MEDMATQTINSCAQRSGQHNNSITTKQLQSIRISSSLLPFFEALITSMSAYRGIAPSDSDTLPLSFPFSSRLPSPGCRAGGGRMTAMPIPVLSRPGQPMPMTLIGRDNDRCDREILTARDHTRHINCPQLSFSPKSPFVSFPKRCAHKASQIAIARMTA